MKWIICVISFLVFGELSAQITFNKRMGFGCGTSVLTNVAIVDSSYYIAGLARDSTTGCQISILWAEVDYQGNIIRHSLYGDSNTIHETWQPTLQLDTDGNFIAGGNYIDDTGLQAMLIKWDVQGNVLWTKMHHSLFPLVQINPPHRDSFTRTDDLVIAPDSSYILAGRTYNGWQLTCFNRDRTVRWVRYTDCLGNFCFEHSILQEDDGFVVGYYNGDANLVSINRTMRCILEKYDYAGNQLWSWSNDSSELLRGANHVIKAKDGGYVIGTADVIETPEPGGHTTRLGYDCLVFKLDSARNRLWSRALRAHDYSIPARIERLIELEDSTIMAFGTTPDTFWSVSENRWHAQYNMLVAQLAPNGDSLWANQYYYFDENPRSRHLITDVERTPDGGYLCAGQAQGSGQGAYQQGWLLKLDSMGCLVPGCRDLVNHVQQLPDPPKAKLLLYPNPATDYLNVHYVHTGKGEHLQWRMLNGQGQVVQEYQSRAVSDQTYIFDVVGLLSGWYVLEVVLDGVPVGREMFVKQ